MTRREVLAAKVAAASGATQVAQLERRVESLTVAIAENQRLERELERVLVDVERAVARVIEGPGPVDVRP